MSNKNRRSQDRKTFTTYRTVLEVQLLPLLFYGNIATILFNSDKFYGKSVEAFINASHDWIVLSELLTTHKSLSDIILYYIMKYYAKRMIEIF